MVNEDELMEACKNGDNEKCKEILGALVSAQLREASGYKMMSASALAVFANRADCLDVLVKAGADVDEIVVFYRKPSKADRSLIGWASCLEGGLACLEVLIQAGGDVNAKYGLYPASHQSLNSSRNESFRKLLEAGADTEARVGGATLLHLASRQGNLECVEALISAGADLEAVDRHGCTPAMYAAELGQAGSLALLHSAGADMHAVNIHGDTARSIARASKRMLECEKVFEWVDAVKDIEKTPAAAKAGSRAKIEIVY